MTNARKDENDVPVILTVSDQDGETIIPVLSTSNALNISDGMTGTDYGTPNAKRDESEVRCLMAVSSIDGSPITLYADSNGNLLVQST